MTESSGSHLRDDEPDDPGRDPVGLHPPRDILDAMGGETGKGEYTPNRTSPADERAASKPDEPPTSTDAGGP